MCFVSVKITLFKVFCIPIYTAYLWCKKQFKQTSGVIKIWYLAGAVLLNLATQVCSTCAAVLCNLMYISMCRQTDSENIILYLANIKQSSIVSICGNTCGNTSDFIYIYTTHLAVLLYLPFHAV